MRLPRSIEIVGKTFTIKTDPTHDGGSVDVDKPLIEIGTSDPSETAENFLHEVGEAIMMMRDFRYALEKEEPENGDYKFILDHKDWQLFSKDLSIALRGVKFDK